jgi:hypothetical protein
MNVRLGRAALACATTALVAVAFAPAATVAQSTGDFISSGGAVANSAADMLRQEIAARKAQRAAAAATGRRQSSDAALQASPPPSAAGGPATPATAASATPEPFESLETPKPGFQHPSSPGVSYTVDLTSSWADGSTGYRQNNLPGGIDASIYATPFKYSRVFAGYYQLHEYPIGFDTGTVPTYVSYAAAGFGNIPGRTNCEAFGPPGAPGTNLHGVIPNCPVNLNKIQYGTNPNYQNDAEVTDRIFVASFQKIVYVGGLVPIVISPSYVARTGLVGGTNDEFLAYDPTTFQYHQIRLRTAENESVLFSLPLIASPKLFAVYSIGPEWLVNTNGNNQTNHAQILQVLDLRYFINPSTTFFFQPSRLQEYLPNDPYPQHIPSLIAGFNRKVGGPNSPLFIQAYFAGGTAQNPPFGKTGRVGVIDVTCVAQYPTCITAPNPRTNSAVTFGGFKADTFVLSVGIGTPSIIPL